jgi:PLD-like domain
MPKLATIVRKPAGGHGGFSQSVIPKLSKTPRAPPVSKTENAPQASGAKIFPQVVIPKNDPTQNLQTFRLLDLAQYTREKSYSSDASADFHLYFVGRDDVHDILKYVLSRTQVSLYLNMFGYDDDELNDIVMQKVLDPHITVLITLDKSQSDSRHEKQLLDLDKQHALAAFHTHFTVGQSLTHQISHTKGFVIDGKVGAEGSTNWSNSGEGTLVEGTYYVKDQIAGAGYKAQNNTQTIITDHDSVVRFQSELIAEHLAARDEEAATVPASKRQQRPKMEDLPAIRKKGIESGFTLQNGGVRPGEDRLRTPDETS